MSVSRFPLGNKMKAIQDGPACCRPRDEVTSYTMQETFCPRSSAKGTESVLRQSLGLAGSSASPILAPANVSLYRRIITSESKVSRISSRSYGETSSRNAGGDHLGSPPRWNIARLGIISAPLVLTRQKTSFQRGFMTLFCIGKMVMVFACSLALRYDPDIPTGPHQRGVSVTRSSQRQRIPRLTVALEGMAFLWLPLSRMLVRRLTWLGWVS